MNNAPTEQGFYVRDTQGWERAVSVPCDHLVAHSDDVILRRDFCYVDTRGGCHVAPLGFPFDGLSIPRLFWRLAGHPFGRNLPAGVIHDVLCAQANALPVGPERQRIRAIGDDIFAEMLEYLGNPSSVVWTWHKCVRIGSLSSRNRAPAPNPVTDMEGYYSHMGLSDVWPWVQDRILRHS